MQEETIEKAIKIAVPFVQEAEGFRPAPYKCPAGKLTIGFGRTYNVDEDDVTTREAETASVTARVEEIIYWLTSLKKHSGLNENQLAALASFIYNFNENQYSTSTLRKCIEKGEFSQAGEQFLRWIHITSASGSKKRNAGLENRRKRERKLFNTPVT